jgi:hypothetical protein
LKNTTTRNFPAVTVAAAMVMARLRAAVVFTAVVPKEGRIAMMPLPVVA